MWGDNYFIQGEIQSAEALTAATPFAFTGGGQKCGALRIDQFLLSLCPFVTAACSDFQDAFLSKGTYVLIAVVLFCVFRSCTSTICNSYISRFGNLPIIFF